MVNSGLAVESARLTKTTGAEDEVKTRSMKNGSVTDDMVAGGKIVRISGVRSKVEKAHLIRSGRYLQSHSTCQKGWHMHSACWTFLKNNSEVEKSPVLTKTSGKDSTCLRGVKLT